MMRRHRLILALSFLVGLLLMLPLQDGWSESPDASALLAPVPAQPSPTFVAQSYLPSPLLNVHLPDTAMRCLEPFGERFDRIGTVKDQGRTVYLLGIYPDFVTTHPLEAHDEVIAVDPNQGCDRLIDSTSIQRPLSSVISTKAAESLELQRYRHAIAQLGGLDAFQQSLSDRIETADGQYLLSAEQVKALNHLHVRFPNTYRLLTNETFPDA